MKTFPIKKYALYGGGVTICTLIVVVLVFVDFREERGTVSEIPPWLEESEEAELEEETEDGVLVVDVKGMVASPGVYELEVGSRLFEAIEKAGGFTDSANREGVNLALRLEDEMVVYVPEEGEEEGAGPVLAVEMNETDHEDTININEATEADLLTLQGVGPSKAAAIIGYREENGSFATVEELMNVSGIGEKTFEALEPFIRVK
ncbi:helix-hairpin-helix domain-containing protein [Shouchella clausii]|uniref:helix-hairpin-helix domain-containing protein n=1 Tax=Shouchella clausii TaxID=79880 RepID=UPI002148D610|nr:helix-hairpin-helix domain-containing protein [Shouchella clausii]MCR1286919.1 helix-hairpin-helix domain-containing protein [Shouchella clausii]